MCAPSRILRRSPRAMVRADTTSTSTRSTSSPGTKVSARAWGWPKRTCTEVSARRFSFPPLRDQSIVLQRSLRRGREHATLPTPAGELGLIDPTAKGSRRLLFGSPDEPEPSRCIASLRPSPDNTSGPRGGRHVKWAPADGREQDQQLGDGNKCAARLTPYGFLTEIESFGFDFEIGRQTAVARPFPGAQFPVDHLHPLQQRQRRVIPHRTCVSRWPASSPSSHSRSQGRIRSPSQVHADLDPSRVDGLIHRHHSGGMEQRDSDVCSGGCPSCS